MQKKHSGPQIVAKLRQADILIGQGKMVPQVCKELEISQHTYYRWRQKYGGMSPDMIKQHRAPQTAGTPKNLHLWFRKNQGKIAIGSL